MTRVSRAEELGCSPELPASYIVELSTGIPGDGSLGGKSTMRTGGSPGCGKGSGSVFGVGSGVGVGVGSGEWAIIVASWS